MPTQSRASYMGKALTVGLAGSMGFTPTASLRNLPRTAGSTSLTTFAQMRDLPIPLPQAQASPEDFARSKEEVEEAFAELVEQWRADTVMASNQVAILMHPAHYKIIGMGPQVLPQIFEDLSKGGGPWYLALESITHEDPVLPEHKRSAKMIRADWIKWGKEHAYVSA